MLEDGLDSSMPILSENTDDIEYDDASRSKRSLGFSKDRGEGKRSRIGLSSTQKVSFDGFNYLIATTESLFRLGDPRMYELILGRREQ